MDRRTFLATGAAAAAVPSLGMAAQPDAAPSSQRVNFISDGLQLSPRDYAGLLQEIVTAQDIEPDNYSLGGEIVRLEALFAERLGKQAAIYLPTGTLANHIAVRTLAGGQRRVIVQAESHLYNDSGDAATTLSGLTLVPLAEGRASIALDDVKRAVERARGGRVELAVGAISIENPVRRCNHEMLDPAELDRLCDYAREQGIRLHLDGSRLFNLPQHSGRSVREHAARFDTVYVSLWKHFNGASGAILAGDARFIDGLYHTRRMFGGALPQAWSQIAPVPRYLDGYEANYARAWQAADAIIAALDAVAGFKARKLERGTSLFFLKTPALDVERVVARASERGIGLARPRPDSGEFSMMVNTSLLRRPAADITRALLDALTG